MSDLHETAEPVGTADSWLTPSAATIAGFTLAVLSLLTNGAWALALQTFIAGRGSGDFQDVVMATGVAQGLIAIAALVLARRGLGSPTPTARNLGGATVILGGLGVVVALLTVVGSLLAGA